MEHHRKVHEHLMYAYIEELCGELEDAAWWHNFKFSPSKMKQFSIENDGPMRCLSGRPFFKWKQDCSCSISLGPSSQPIMDKF